MADDPVVREWHISWAHSPEHNALARAYQDLWDDVAHLERTRAEIKGQLAAMTTQLDEALRSASHLGETAEVLQAQLAAVTAERDSLKSLEEEVSALEERFNENRAELGLARISHNNLAEQLAASEAERQKLERSYAEDVARIAAICERVLGK